MGEIQRQFGALIRPRMKVSALERICSPVVRLCFGSLWFSSFARLMFEIR